MDIWIGFAVAALKAGVSGVVGNEIVQALADQGIDIGSDKLSQYLEKAQKELRQVLSDKSLTKMNVSEKYIDYIKEEIKGLLRSVSLDEDLFRNCRYDAESLAEALYKKYKRQKKDFVECESEIQKVLYAMSDKAISLEKGRGGFTADSLIHIMEIEDEQIELLRKILHTLDESMKTGITDSENGGELQRKKRLPDRTDEYRRKWTENMFLNDFDEDDAEAGVNIPLCKLHQPSFYRLKGQNKDLANLEERLDKCTQGKDTKNRMLLILGQPGMGKSTMITWFLDRYQKKEEADKKEILVYRFTDLEVEWNFAFNREEKSIDTAILECLNMNEEDLNGKILILDGFDEVSAGQNRLGILNCLYNAWGKEARIKDFSLVITCRENYIEHLSWLSFPYITLQTWNEEQIETFCKTYEKLTGVEILDEAIYKMKEMKNVFGIPILLYMTLALEITVKDESSVVEVYDQIFSLEGGIYDRCLKTDASIRWDEEHRIANIKKQIHQFSREISLWMFENNPQQAAIPKDEYEMIRDRIFAKYNDIDKSQKKDVLIGNYFRRVHCYDGVDTEQLTFVHRSIYEYFVAETICWEIAGLVREMKVETQAKLAGVLGYRLKKGRIDYTIGQYLKAKMNALLITLCEAKKKYFWIWLEETVGKMMDEGMFYYTDKNIKEYKYLLEKELNCFQNLLDVLRLFVDFSEEEYIKPYDDLEWCVFYIKCLINLANVRADIQIDLSNVDLQKADLRKVDLRKVNLREANLRGANLQEANLSEANLQGTDLSKASLNEVILRQAVLYTVNLSEADLSNADLRGADLSEANLREANLSGADLSGANLNGINLIEANLERVNLNGVSLEGAYLGSSQWQQEDVDKYFDLIKEANFAVIYVCSKRKRELTREEFLNRATKVI